MKIVREWAAEFTTQRRQLTSSSKGSWMDSLECEIGRGGVSFSIERLGPSCHSLQAAKPEDGNSSSKAPKHAATSPAGLGV